MAFLLEGEGGVLAVELSIRTRLSKKRDLTAILGRFFDSWKAEIVGDFYIATVDAEPRRIRRLVLSLEQARMKLS